MADTISKVPVEGSGKEGDVKPCTGSMDLKKILARGIDPSSIPHGFCSRTINVVITRSYSDLMYIQTAKTKMEISTAKFQELTEKDEKEALLAGQMQSFGFETYVIDKIRPMKIHDLELLQRTRNWHSVENLESELVSLSFNEPPELTSEIMARVPQDIKERVMTKCDDIRKSIDTIRQADSRNEMERVRVIKSSRNMSAGKGFFVDANFAVVQKNDIEVIVRDVPEKWTFVEGSIYQISGFNLEKSDGKVKLICNNEVNLECVGVAPKDSIRSLERSFSLFSSVSAPNFIPLHKEADVVGNVTEISSTSDGKRIQLEDRFKNRLNIFFYALNWTTKLDECLKPGIEVQIFNLKWDPIRSKSKNALFANSRTNFAYCTEN